MTLPLTAVVIVNWNLCQDTLACLRSVQEMSYPASRVIVVDNGSTDDSVTEIQRAFPQVLQLLNERNEGYAAGANRGIEHALSEGCDYVLLLNNDTIVQADLLERLIAVSQVDSRIGIAAPCILYFGDPERTWQLATRWHRWLPVPLNLTRPPAGEATGAGPALLEADFVSGCAMLLRRSLLEEVGTFDPSYFMYGEDADLCARAKQAGYRVVAVPDARIWHKVSASASRVSREMRYFKTRGQVLIARRYHHGPVPGLWRAYVGAKLARDLAVHLLAGQFTLVPPLLRGALAGLSHPLGDRT